MHSNASFAELLKISILDLPAPLTALHQPLPYQAVAILEAIFNSLDKLIRLGICMEWSTLPAKFFQSNLLIPRDLPEFCGQQSSYDEKRWDIIVQTASTYYVMTTRQCPLLQA
jgi:hypothetical protein